jgi:adenylate cyclase
MLLCSGDDDLLDATQRAWLAYLRQELTAPMAALAEYARELTTQCHSTGHAESANGAARIASRANQLLQSVQQFTEPVQDKANAQSADYWRSVRHDLRGAAAYIVMAVEDIQEGAPANIQAQLQAELTRTLQAARHVIERIEDVVKFRQDPSQLAAPADSVREMLSRLTVLRTAQERALTGRVLVVDDNEYGRDIVARLLKQLGHEAEVVTGGHEAQRRLKDSTLEPIDLILLDVMMPGMTGPELLVWLKNDAHLWSMPVIMVSALGDDEGVLACIAAGAEDYLTRPVKRELLQARIAGCLEKQRLRDREAEYQASIDRLVRSIFPPAVVSEWQSTGTVQPRRHDHVGVLFLDVVGFTNFCEQFRDDPAQVLRPLQELIERFEKTVSRHGVQKIKTIGDAFLGVAGLLDPDPKPALTLLRCGLDLVQDVLSHPIGWQVRVGVHIGPVVTGILGQQQFSFDLWGHTVNAAARIESNGQPGRVTLSEEAWKSLEGIAVGEPRQIAARGIGLMTVWDFIEWMKAN